MLKCTVIVIKSDEEVSKMRRAGKLAYETLCFIEPYVKAGVSTLELNDLCHDYILRHFATPAPLHYKGFPKSICTSINEVVCHGIPQKEDILKDGDIINIDITVILNGYHGDVSKTFAVGIPGEKKNKLLKAAENALYVGISSVRPGSYLTSIGYQIENFVRPMGYSVVRDFGGHGLGAKFHEDPFVPHFWVGKNKTVLRPNMIFTIEPMINEGSYKTYVDEEDGWTARTEDGGLSAQFEHTVLVTPTGYEILTTD